MSEKDGLPKTICTECAEKLDDFYSFRDLSRKIDSALNELFQSETNKSDSDCSNSKTSETSKDKGKTNFGRKFFGQCFKVIALKSDLLLCSLPTIMTFQKIFFHIFYFDVSVYFNLSLFYILLG